MYHPRYFNRSENRDSQEGVLDYGSALFPSLINVVFLFGRGALYSVLKTKILRGGTLFWGGGGTTWGKKNSKIAKEASGKHMSYAYARDKKFRYTGGMAVYRPTRQTQW